MDEKLIQKILSSGLFDDAWYSSTYRDVPAIPMSALSHYMRFGYLMGRAPSLLFDGEKYLEANPDVKAAGMNPLLHYVQHGKSEGRPIEPARFSGSSPAPAKIASAAAGLKTAKLPLTALVITWDIGHNPLGRSYMLAEVLDRVVRNVVITGFQFERYGTNIWEPVRDGRLPVIPLRGSNFPQFLDELEQLSQRIRPDIVFACKPRLPSLQLAAMIKHKTQCPLVLDIDDHELSFFKGGDEITLADLRALPIEAAVAHSEPYGETWTRLAQSMRKYADEIIVSNVALQREFQGTIVPHVRDERVFDPMLHDRVRSRESFGIPANAKVALFFGTPRHHKGIDVLAEAVGKIPDPEFRLVIVGTTTDKSITSKLEALAPGRLIYFPNQPFARIPEVIAMADVVCLPQDEKNPISQYQLPAKAIDAIAMGIPLLVAPTPPLMQLVRDGVAQAIDLERLPQMLQEAVKLAASHHEPASETRQQYLRGYSYASAADSLRTLIIRAMHNVDVDRTKNVPKLIEEQRRLFGSSTSTVAPSTGTDIVVFWKQNDTGLYGRRSDMIVRYLASRGDVRRVMVFDAPISEHDLLVRRNKSDGLTHDRLIYTKTYEKIFGVLDTPKVSFDTFTYPPGRYRTSEDGTSRQLQSEAYLRYIGDALIREDIDPSSSIFWIYPKNYLAGELVAHFSPKKVVVDVVDDHRAWPGISDAERDRLTRNYEQVLAQADMAFANCEPVLESMRAFAPDIRLVPNGCDEKISLVEPDNAAFREFVAFPGKTIGFIGNLEKKIDIGLIGKVASHFSDCQVVLLGSTHANPDVRELQSHPNVRMPGVVPYAEIAAWVSHFDVGIIPHLKMELTRSMNPLKLYVYLSSGVPVVSTEIDNVDRTSSFVKIASTHEQFMQFVAELLAAGKEKSQALDRYVRANSWTSRMEPHMNELLSK